MSNTAIPCLNELCFAELHGCYIFYKFMAIPSTNQKSMTHFIAIIILLWWSGTETTVSPRIPIVICAHSMSLFQNVEVMHCISHVIMGASSTMGSVGSYGTSGSDIYISN